MKITIVTSDFPPAVGGISTLNAVLARSLASLPEIERVSVLAFNNKERSIKTEGKLLVERRPSIGLLPLAASLLSSRALREADVVHATNVFPVGFLALIAGKLFGKRVVISFYGTDLLGLGGGVMTTWAKRFTVAHADAPVALSFSTRAEVSRLLRVPEGRFPVIYAPLGELSSPASPESIGRARAACSIDPGDVVVLFVGNLVQRKGAHDLIEAVSALPPRVKLIIVGKGPEEASLKKLADERAPQRVCFPGRVSEIEPYYALADVFSMPSYFIREEGDIEGLGIVYLEAQQRGVPVVGTRSGGIPEAIDEGGSGFVVPERDVRGLSERIGALARDPALRRRMGERGRVFVGEKFNATAISRAYLSVYGNP